MRSTVICLAVIPLLLVSPALCEDVSDPAEASGETEVRTRLNTIEYNELSACVSLWTLAATQVDHRNLSAAGGFFTDLAELEGGFKTKHGEVFKTVAEKLASGRRDGYVFELKVPEQPEGPPESFSVTAYPSDYGETGTRSFYIDETGMLRGADIGGVPGTQNLPALTEEERNAIDANQNRVMW